jgi:hypothetical protein
VDDGSYDRGVEVAHGEARGEGETGPVLPTIDPADIRGLATTVLRSVWRLPLSRLEGRPESPRNVLEGYACIGGPRPASAPGELTRVAWRARSPT